MGVVSGFLLLLAGIAIVFVVLGIHEAFPGLDEERRHWD